MTEARTTWTEADFDELSWHDNYVHGLRIRGGDHGAGELELDIDFIVEWVKGTLGRVMFRIAPAMLIFRDVRNLKLDLDDSAQGAAFEPFSISEIRRTPVDRMPRLWQWTITAAWPSGALTFEASGFTQTLGAAPILKSQQRLDPGERVRGM